MLPSRVQHLFTPNLSRAGINTLLRDLVRNSDMVMRVHLVFTNHAELRIVDFLNLTIKGLGLLAGSYLANVLVLLYYNE